MQAVKVALLCAALLGNVFSAPSDLMDPLRRFSSLISSSSRSKSVSKNLSAMDSLLSCSSNNLSELCDVKAADALLVSELYCKALLIVPADKYKQLGLKPIELKLIQLKCNANFDLPSQNNEESRSKVE